MKTPMKTKRPLDDELLAVLRDEIRTGELFAGPRTAPGWVEEILADRDYWEAEAMRYRARVQVTDEDILDEMAATEVDGEGQRIATLDDLDTLVGRRVQFGFYGWTYNDDQLEWTHSGTLGRDGFWLTIDGVKVAKFDDDGRRGTPYVRVRLVEVDAQT
jgi:hypothetical protein